MSNLQIASSARRTSARTFHLAAETTSIQPPHQLVECPAAIKRLVQPIQQWLDAIEVQDADAARLLYKIIPGQCPFERDITLFGQTILRIPPLCKLNPFYDQLVALRFRAMCYLVDECGEALETL